MDERHPLSQRVALLQQVDHDRMSAEGIAVLNIKGTDLFIIVHFDLSSGGTSEMVHTSQRFTEQELRERDWLEQV